jgi:pimeloyl-ACP methyl ester carboxylesterase
VAFEYYRRRPDNVAALIPTLSTWGRTVETFFDTRASLLGFAAFKGLTRLAPDLLASAARPVMLSGFAERAARLLGIVDAALAPHELMVAFMEQLSRMDLRTYAALGQSLQDHDASDLLGQIAVPTLVVAAEKDWFTPIRLAHEMARRIPGAELLVIPNGTHAALVEQPDLLALRVDQFLEDRVVGRKRAPPSR